MNKRKKWTRTEEEKRRDVDNFITNEAPSVLNRKKDLRTKRRSNVGGGGKSSGTASVVYNQRRIKDQTCRQGRNLRGPAGKWRESLKWTERRPKTLLYSSKRKKQATTGRKTDPALFEKRNRFNREKRVGKKNEVAGRQT